MKRLQGGFSLIELVIVVIILGLLAVTALPRFLNVTDEAQIANVEGMAGGFATGVSLVRAQWGAEGRPQLNNANSVSYDGIQLYLSTASNSPLVSPGYPVGNLPAHSASPNMTAQQCAIVWNGILQNPASLTSAIAEANNHRYFVATTASNLCVYYLIQTLNRNRGGAIDDPAGATNIGNNFVYDPATGRVSVNIN